MEYLRYKPVGSGKYQGNINNNQKKYQNINTSGNANIDINKYSSTYKNVENSSLDNNNQIGYNSVNKTENAKIRKFNSYSAKTGYNNRGNEINNGFYVTPIPNIPLRLITVKVPDNNIIDTQTNYFRQVEEVQFKVVPKKYICKPYKQPRRKHVLISSKSQKGSNFYKYTGSINKRKY